MRAWNLLLLILTLLLGAPGARAFDPQQDIRLGVEKGALVVKVPEGVHLKCAFMSVALKAPAAGKLQVGPMPPKHDVDELGDGIWRGRVVVPLKGAGLTDPVLLEVEYQPCTEGDGGVCFPPTMQTLKVAAAQIPSVPPAPAAEVPRPETPATMSQAPAPTPELAPVPAPVPAAPQPSGLWWTLLAAFGWGLAASLTPCVYPMIPITMAIVGAKGQGRLRGFLLSLSLVMGLAVTYTVLGVVAARLGAAAGAWAQTAAFLVPVALLFALFALSLFGAFEIRLPEALANRLQGSGPRRGFGGAFVMGLVLGPLAAPCVGPFVGTVLVDIAQKGSVLLGALNLFVFALGMGVLFLVVGTFSAALPKGGDWMIRFKQFMGLLVLGFAAWSVRLLVPYWANALMWTLVTLTGAAVLGAFEPAAGLRGQVRKGLGMMLVVLGALLGVRAVETFLKVDLLPRGTAAAAAVAAHITWIEQDYEGALKQAKTQGKLVLVDLYADWCAQCKELDEKTWPDPTLQAWITRNAVPVRVDPDAKRKDLRPTFKAAGYPTVLLLDAEGRELKRILGFQPPDTMLKLLDGK